MLNIGQISEISFFCISLFATRIVTLSKSLINKFLLKIFLIKIVNGL